MKKCIDDGFIRLHRSLLKWEWFTDGNTLVVFVYLLLTANWQDTRYRGKEIKRGQVVVTVAELSKLLLMTTQQVRTALEHLKTTGEISTKNLTRNGTLVTIEKYDFYQSDSSKGNKQNNKQTTNKQQINNKQNENLPTYRETYKNIKNEKNILVCLTDEEFEELFSHIADEDQLALSDELVSIPAEGISNCYNYAVGVAKNLGLWRNI